METQVDGTRSDAEWAFASAKLHNHGIRRVILISLSEIYVYLCRCIKNCKLYVAVVGVASLRASAPPHTKWISQMAHCSRMPWRAFRLRVISGSAVRAAAQLKRAFSESNKIEISRNAEYIELKRYHFHAEYMGGRVRAHTAALLTQPPKLRARRKTINSIMSNEIIWFGAHFNLISFMGVIVNASNRRNRLLGVMMCLANMAKRARMR